MTRMTRPDCAVMCNLINTHTHTHTNKNDKEKATRITKSIYMPEKDRPRALDRESLAVASHPIPSPDRNHAPKRAASTTFRTLRVSVFTNGTIDVA